MKTLGIIPAYNEQKIEEVANASSKFLDKIVIIDDGSDIPIKKSNRKKYEVLRNTNRKGKGYSIRRGFDYAIKNKYNFLILLDGDGEHNPEYIPLMLKKLKSKDIVIGQRTRYRSFHRRILNLWSSLFIYLLTSKIKDAHCGFKAINLKRLKQLKLKSDGFEIDLELILEPIKNNWDIEVVKIKPEISNRSTVKLKDCVKMNNFLCKWILSNALILDIPNYKKGLLLLGALIGLLTTGVIRR